MKDWLNCCVACANLIGDHVWAMALIAVGAVLTGIGHADTGNLLVGGGLALFRGQNGNDDTK